MADYIDREAAKVFFMNMDAGRRCPCSTLLTPEEFTEYLDEIPAADVAPVVRCKDCKRWQRHSEINRDYGGCRRYSSTMRYDDFCSQGERRTGNENRLYHGV